MTKLTDTKIKNAKPKDKQYTLSDGDKLSLTIKVNGSKLWEIRYYKPYSKKRANISLGKYPATTLKLARRQRDEINSLLAQNIDPKVHRDDLKQQISNDQSNTFLVYTEKWHALQKEKVKPITINGAFKILQRHFLPDLGNVPVLDLTPQMVIATLAPLKANDSIETLKKLLRYVNQIMRLAKIEGAIQFNPLDDLTKIYAPPARTNRPTIKPGELPLLMRTLAHAKIDLQTRCLIEWQLRSLTRPGETAKARWEHINLDEKIWTIPASEMKMKREHKIPITPQMEKILNIAKKLNLNKSIYVFQGRANLNTHASVQTANMALKRMGYGGILVAHGLRALASTTMNEAKGSDNRYLFNRDVIESALAHVDSNTIRSAYNRAEYLDGKRELLSWWSDHIDNAAIDQNTIANQFGFLSK